jgi:hypothetical protein
MNSTQTTESVPCEMTTAVASRICVLATAGVEYKARLSYAGVQQLLDAAAGRQPSIRLSGPLAVVLGRADLLA